MSRILPGPLNRIATARKNRKRLTFTPAHRVWRGLLIAIASCSILTGMLLILRNHLSSANIALAYLVPVLAGATVGGFGAGVLAALVSALAFDVLFIYPVGTISISQEQDLLTLLFYLVVGALVSQLAGHARVRTEKAVRRAVTSDQLYDLSSVFLAGDLSAMLGALVERLGVAFELRSCSVLLPDRHGTLRTQAHWGPVLGMTSPDDKRQLDAVATWAYTQGDVVGFSLDRPAPGNSIRRGALVREPHSGSTGVSKETVLFLPLRTSQVRGGEQTTGVLALARPVGSPFSAEETRLLGTFATQAALAIDRARLADASAQAAILRESDLAKSTLLSNVSHDLRTPLTTIRGAAESLMAADVRLDEQTRQELLTSIRDESDRLSALVGNLLNLSRLEAGALRMEQHLYNLSEIAGSVAARLCPRLPDHHVQLALAPDVPSVLDDYALFEQVLLNLLDNAAKYSPEDTTIVIGLRREGDLAILSVADEGPGIPRSARNRVFERFYRVPQAGPKRVPGTGLGLAICRAVVAAHGGRIWIDDRSRVGTTISISLPIPPVPAELDLVAAEKAR